MPGTGNRTCAVARSRRSRQGAAAPCAAHGARGPVLWRQPAFHVHQPFVVPKKDASRESVSASAKSTGDAPPGGDWDGWEAHLFDRAHLSCARLDPQCPLEAALAEADRVCHLTDDEARVEAAAAAEASYKFVDVKEEEAEEVDVDQEIEERGVKVQLEVENTNDDEAIAAAYVEDSSGVDKSFLVVNKIPKDTEAASPAPEPQDAGKEVADAEQQVEDAVELESVVAVDEAALIDEPGRVVEEPSEPASEPVLAAEAARAEKQREPGVSVWPPRPWYIPASEAAKAGAAAGEELEAMSAGQGVELAEAEVPAEAAAAPAEAPGSGGEPQETMACRSDDLAMTEVPAAGEHPLAIEEEDVIESGEGEEEEKKVMVEVELVSRPIEMEEEQEEVMVASASIDATPAESATSSSYSEPARPSASERAPLPAAMPADDAPSVAAQAVPSRAVEVETGGEAAAVVSVAQDDTAREFSSVVPFMRSAPLKAPEAKLVEFRVRKEVPFGSSVKLVGCHDMLGGWNLEQGVGMQWQDGHVWTAQVPLDATQCEFKFVVASGCGQHVHWEALPENRSLRVPSEAAAVVAEADFDCPKGVRVMTHEGREAAL